MKHNVESQNGQWATIMVALRGGGGKQEQSRGNPVYVAIENLKIPLTHLLKLLK
jgi:hypothetical protein